MTLHRIDRLLLSLAAITATFLLFALTSCDVAENDGHTYLTFAKDTVWAKYDSLEVTWIDTLSGAGGLLFHGDPAKLKDKNRVEAEGYHGQKILILFKGFIDGAQAYEERRGFDGATGGITTAVIPIGPGPIIPIGPGDGQKARAPRLSAIQAETLMTINDSTSFQANALLDSGSLKSYAWDYDGDGKMDDSAGLGGGSAVVRGGHRFRVPGAFVAVLRVYAADSSSTAQVNVVVAKDEPTAYAGADQTVYPEGTINLSGTGKDGMGKVALMEWKIGEGEYVEGATISFQAPSAPGDVSCRFRVTDDDSLSIEDEVVIHVISRTESNLTGIMVSSGRLHPQFNPSVLGYSDTVVYETQSISVTPAGNGAITVNDHSINSGQASPPFGLAVGNNPILLTVKVAGTTGKAYQVNVVRLPPSADANLAELTVSAGALDSAFNPDDTLYSIQAPNGSAFTQITAVLANPKSSLSINGFMVKNGTISGSIPLAIGPNTINVEVAAQDGGIKTYTLTVIRAEDGNSDLASLALSAGAIGPPFSISVTEYELTVPFNVASTEITAAPVRTTSSLTIGGKPTAAGKAVSVGLDVGGTLIPVIITAQNGTRTTYTIRVTRAGNGNADLFGITLSAGELSPVFSADAVFYTAAVPNDSKTMDITATLAIGTSDLSVNGQPAVSGKPFALALTVGANTITLAVTAQNGDKKAYTVSTIRAKNANADLNALSLSAGALSPAFATATLAYTATVSNSTASVTVTPQVTESTSTVTVNGTAVASDSASTAVSLNVGSNSIPVVVTAQSGGTRTYSLTVTRGLNSNANLSALLSTGGILGPAFDPATAAYTLAVANPVASITVTPTVAVGTSTVKVNGVAVASGSASGALALNVGANPFTVQVTAQDSAVKAYTITVTRAASSNADLSAMSVSAGTLTPSFAAGTIAYALSVANNVASTTVTPTVTIGTTTVKVNGTAVISGSASGAIALSVGANTLTVLATAQDNSAKTYTVTVTRAANSNADLSSLSVSAGALTPVFATGTTAYVLSVANSVTSTTVTPTAGVGTTTVKVNGAAVASGTVSGAIALNVGTNTITVLATAQDNTAKTYIVSVTRAPNANADLSAAAVSAGPLVPVFASATTVYALTVANNIASTTVTPTVAAGTSTVKVNGATVASGSASAAIALPVGTTTATISVTAESAATKTYTVAVTRNPGLKIAAGYFHTLVLKSDKTLWGAGSNSFGTLADGTGINQSRLIQMASDVANMSGGYYNTVAVKSGGGVVGSGGNYFGSMGIDVVKCSSFVDLMSGVVKVASGYGHTMFLKTNGSVWSSGWNYHGTIGNGGSGIENGGSVIIPIEIISSVTDVAAGFGHSLFLRSDATLWGTGENLEGALGNGANEDVASPVQIMGNVAGMAGGSSFTQILRKDGTLWATGRNTNGELGDGSLNNRNTPGQVMMGVASVACGSGHTLILKIDGTLWATGSNSVGQLGDGSFNNQLSFVHIMSDVYSIAAGGGTSMAVKKNGTLWTWGGGTNGQLGDGSNSDRNSPAQILP